MSLAAYALAQRADFVVQIRIKIDIFCLLTKFSAKNDVILGERTQSNPLGIH